MTSSHTRRLVTNTALAEHDCNWCGARKGKDVHTPACPIGERYQQIQTGEVSRCLECGAAVEDFDLTCDHCHGQIKKRRALSSDEEQSHG